MIRTHLIRGLSLDIPSPGSSGDEPPILAGVFWRWQLWKLLELLLENPNVKGSLRALCGLRPRRAVGRTLRDIIVKIAKKQFSPEHWFSLHSFSPANTMYISWYFLPLWYHVGNRTTTCPCRFSNLGPHLFQSSGWCPEWTDDLLLASRWVLTSLETSFKKVQTKFTKTTEKCYITVFEHTPLWNS